MSKAIDDFIEQERLKALAAYDILDTAPEAEFDEISRLAAIICGTPISAITLVDEYRQWFKASVGLPVRETPRNIAFCHHVVERREELIVSDASQSSVFADNPLVTNEPHIRFYAGTPLLSEEGLVVGSVCVIDRVPRELQPEQLEALRILARQASALLSQRLRQRELLKMTGEAIDREANVKWLKSEQEGLLASLSVSETRYRSLFQEHPQPVWVFEMATLRFLEVNDAAVKLYGYSRTEFLNMTLHGFWPQEEMAARSAIAKSENIELRESLQKFIAKDGRVVLAELTSKVILYDNVPARLMVSVDVTEREALRRSNLEALLKIQQTSERLEFALESAHIGEWQINYQTGEQYFSKIHSQCYGRPWQAASVQNSKYFLESIHAEDRQRVEETMLNARACGSRYEIDFRVVWPDRSIHWLRGIGRFYNDASGKPLRAAGLIFEVTEKVKAAERLALYERAIEAANTGILITDAKHPDHPITYVNQAFQQITGYVKEEILGKNCRFLQGEGTNRARVAALREAIAQRRPFQVELDNYRKDGAQFCNHLYVSPVFDSSGELTNYVGIQNDVTSLKNAEQSAASRAMQQEALAEFGLFVLSERSIHEINEEAIRCVVQTLHVKYAKYLTAIPHSENFSIAAGSREGTDFHPGKTISGARGTYARFAFDSVDPVRVDDFSNSHAFGLNPGLKALGIVSGISAAVGSDNQRHGTLTVFSKVKNRFSPGDVAFLQAIANILATALERADSERQLSFLAHHDGLTKLPNRLMLEDRLAHAIARAERSGNSLALMFIDLNRFKVINDSLGHHVGDELLKAVAIRLQNCLRIGDTLSRQGGDEYMLLMEDVVDSKTVSTVAEKILHSLQAPFQLMGKTFHISASIGIALFPTDAREPTELQRLADAAMYRAKELHINGAYQFFTPEINALTQDRWVLEQGLRNALSSNAMRLVYQPKLNLRTGKITSVEALLRWCHPLAGDISPARFIPVAESTGLILMIGEWVFREACKQAVQWRSLGHAITVAVNVSARQFHQQDFVSTIAMTLSQTGCQAEWIDIEITETGIMRDAEKVVEQLHALKRLGISISIDDFGTGYSSLSYLNRFDVDFLKIDQSFIRDITTDKDSRAIASSIIALAHSLGLLVVAEGVETEEQRSILVSWNCDFVQGYLIARPTEPEACTTFWLDGAGNNGAY